LIFSTADVQQLEDEYNEDGEIAENEDDEAGSLYPLRASLNITKVKFGVWCYMYCPFC
jgi:complement component 1 Q subcomponent-binding protein